MFTRILFGWKNSIVLDKHCNECSINDLSMTKLKEESKRERKRGAGSSVNKICFVYSWDHWGEQIIRFVESGIHHSARRFHSSGPHIRRCPEKWVQRHSRVALDPISPMAIFRSRYFLLEYFCTPISQNIYRLYMYAHKNTHIPLYTYACTHKCRGPISLVYPFHTIPFFLKMRIK